MSTNISKEAPAAAAWPELVRRYVSSLRYGAVQIVVHDGHVTQIEKTERVRFEPPGRTAAQAQPGPGRPSNS